MKPRLRIVVLGMMGRLPFGGHVWLFLNWLRAFDLLGHEVWYVEDDTAWPYDPIANAVTDDCSNTVAKISSWMASIGLRDRWAFRLADRQGACWGLTPVKLEELYRSSDLLLNLEGGTILRDEHLVAPFRVYLETDPVIAELELATDPSAGDPFALHHAIATYGENFGSPDCGVPLTNRAFVKTRQPVDLDLWPAVFDSDARYFTTVGNYRQEGDDREYQGKVYRWSKHVEWNRFIDLPRRSSQQFELALSSLDSNDRIHLQNHGWRVVDALPMSLDIFGSYREYLQTSRAEFTVAKDMNVRLRSGWFSERDVCYLASGKPVVAQDTGFSNAIPCGSGLFAFSELGEVEDAIHAINCDYQSQCRAARELAREFFEAGSVARRLLLDLGLG